MTSISKREGNRAMARGAMLPRGSLWGQQVQASICCMANDGGHADCAVFTTLRACAAVSAVLIGNRLLSTCQLPQRVATQAACGSGNRCDAWGAV